MSPSRLTLKDLPSVRLSRVTLPVALVAALLVGLGAPVAWFAMSLGAARSEVRVLAERAASQVRRLAEESPDLWAYNTPKVAEYLALAQAGEPFSIRVADRNGKTVYSQEADESPRLWQLVKVSHGGQPLAVVVAGLPVKFLLARGLGLLVAFSLAGFLLGGVLCVLPLTVLRRSEARLIQMVDRLQQARTELTELNAGLEKRVDEKTASLRSAHQLLQEQQERLRHLAASTFSGQEEERQIIAADLHDSVGQLLTAARINLESAGALARGLAPEEGPATAGGPACGMGTAEGMGTAGGAGLAAIIEDTGKLVDETTERIRRAIRVLGTPLLDQGGLEAGVRTLVANFRHSSCAVEVECLPPPELAVSPAVQSCAFRVVQEALTNAMRHGRPGRVAIALTERSGTLEVTVCDDGLGAAEPFNPGMGLRTMRDRVSLLGGSVEIGPGQDGRGTRVRATLPLGFPEPDGSGEHERV